MQLKKLFLILVMIFFGLQAFASGEKIVDSTEEKLNIPELIMGHIGDEYEWHITTVNNHPISIPLPVIVRGIDGKWHIFSSSKLHGETSDYQGFYISHSEKYKGKIVQKNETGEELRPLDFSLTKNALSLLINSTILVLIVLFCAKWYKNRKAENSNPKGFVALMEMFIMNIVDDIIKPCIGKNYKRYTPYLLVVFFFIFINNIMGIIPIFPGGANITGNIAITFTLAIFSFIIINIFGTKEYWKEIFWPDVPTWLKIPIPIMPVIEIIGMFTKPFALMIRLFANILGGHSVVLGLLCVIFVTAGLGTAINSSMSVMSVIMTVFVDFIEILVAYIQAYVFTILSAVFIGLSQVEPHHEKIKN